MWQTWTTERLLRNRRHLRAPRDAVISVGRRNTFGHPRAEVLARTAQAHTRLYLTDEFGLTRFLLTPNGNISESEDQPQ